MAKRIVEMGIPPNGRVLDLGTGPGFVAIEIAKIFRGSNRRVVGLDLSAPMLAAAAENAAREGVDGILSWREGDNKAMPFGDGEFDAIVSNDSLHHWRNPLPVFDEIARVVKPGGALAIKDSKRLQHWWPWMFVKAISLSIPPDFRIHWWNSIESSYTADELRAILRRSRLAECQVEEGFLDLAVVKERELCPDW
ncbi:MAG: class I SAM-dependent methyltransferase [Anaerolineales bacterium]|nr:class I SAM-dependent methyltransferase [Anaerolineales bacterium]